MTVLQGPYKTRLENKRLHVDYVGNLQFSPMADVFSMTYAMADFAARVDFFVRQPYWGAITRLNNAVFVASVRYFTELGAAFIPLPLITRMISSPGAHLGPQRISYTTDTAPVTLRWFDDERVAFLSESSQIYLELSLAQPSVRQVFSIYNSFRKEQSDATHLAEFHHIEYEGKVGQDRNAEIAAGLLQRLATLLVNEYEADLAHFLRPQEIHALGDFGTSPRLHKIPFSEALEALYEDTGDPRFQEFTLENTLGAAEEVRLTEIYGGFVVVSHFPLLEVPFYHTQVPGSQPPVALNADFIWPGYREVIGSGERIGSLNELIEKARTFELPPQDYEPYIQCRRFESYERTSGFGLGWERLLQGLLKTPFIWSNVHFPRVSGGVAP